MCAATNLALFKQKIGTKFFTLNSYHLLFTIFLPAERQGFEPWEQLPVHRISSAARSTTPASFLKTVQK